MEEIWKDVIGYEDAYQVSNLGCVRSVDRIILNTSGRYILVHGKVLKLRHNNNGYLYVILSKCQSKKFVFVHRLIASAFLPNTDNKPEIDHINAIRDDNRVSNLRWVTKIENRNNPHTIISNRESNRLARRKSLDSVKKKILQLDLDGNILKVFESLHNIEKTTGYSRANICRCCNGKKKICYGFKWEFM